jgi:hypothetical protein
MSKKPIGALTIFKIDKAETNKDEEILLNYICTRSLYKNKSSIHLQYFKRNKFIRISPGFCFYIRAL